MKKFLYLIIIYILVFLLSGCWNYREIERLSIISGVAVDQGKEGKFAVTFEVINISSGDKGGEINPVYIEMEGDTFFDAARRAVALSGKRLYWGHTKVAVLGEDVAKREVDRVLDFLVRDSEIREDMWLVVAKDNTAKEILQGKTLLEKILSFEVDNSLRAQKVIARYPSVNLFEFRNRLFGDKDSGFLPAVSNMETAQGIAFQMGGTALFRRNNLVGWLDEIDSKFLLLIRNEIEGGLIVIKNVADSNTNVALEILKSKTKVKPLVSSTGKPKFEISINMTLNIGELEGSADFIKEDGREVLTKEAEKYLQQNTERLIKMIQEEYNTDVFGFGRKIEAHYPKQWKLIKDDWDKHFPEVEATVNVKVLIAGSATSRKPIMLGD